MITDAQFIEQEAEILAIFEREEASSYARKQTAPVEEVESVQRTIDASAAARIDKILELAQYEVVIKDTTSFLFNTLGAGINGLAKAAFGALDPAARTNHPSSNIQNTKGAQPDKPERRTNEPL
jgi:hypothetical protein